MLKNHFLVNKIPCTMWGDGTEEKVILAVHGNFSHKEDACIEILAQEAVKKGYQVLSFDLPAHGDRMGDEKECHIKHAVSDIQCISTWVKEHFSEVALFACSIGASFSMLALQPGYFSQSLLLSPVIDLLALIRKMMLSAGIDEVQLSREKVITITNGPTFRADYLDYLKQHSHTIWEGDLGILIGSDDDVADYAAAQAFIRENSGILEVMEGAGHYFHRPEELKAMREWFRHSLN